MERFAIHDIAARAGRIGICPLPGRYGAYAQDLQSLLAWRPDQVISLTEEDEMHPAPNLRNDLVAQGIAHTHLPIPDYGVPDQDWSGPLFQWQQALQNGARLVFHCKGGCGRSGMVALKLLHLFGVLDALTALRGVRPCAVETEAQMAWAMIRPQTDPDQ